jgi:hypothetical protein
MVHGVVKGAELGHVLLDLSPAIGMPSHDDLFETREFHKKNTGIRFFPYNPNRP